jgi:hypothetical protein
MHDRRGDLESMTVAAQLRDGPGGARWAAADVPGRIALLAACVVVLVLRAPNLLAAPRLWAEEGAAFFRHAYEHSPLGALVFVHPGANYLVLSTNVLAALAAHAVPLEWAPWITTYGALIIQLVPLTIVIFGSSSVFCTFARRLAGCAILLLASTQTGEVWLTSLHSQVYWGAAAVAILLDDLAVASPLRRWVYRFVLGIGALSSVYVSFLLPVFALRAWTQRGERCIHLAILSAAFVVQVTIAATFASGGALNPKRLSPVHLDTVTFAAAEQVAFPLFGRRGNNAINRWLGRGSSGLIFLAVIAGVTAMTFASCLRRRLSRDDPRVVLVLSFLFLFLGTCLTAFEGKAGGRYAVVSGFVVLFLCLASIPRHRPSWSAVVPALLLACGLYVGGRDYRVDPRLCCDGDSSRWRSEVARWREDPAHEIPLCPEPWTLSLTPRAGDTRRWEMPPR